MDLGDEVIDGWPIRRPAHVALVGGGGKTTLMRALYASARRRGWSAAAGTTTKVGADQVDGLDPFLFSHVEGQKLVGLDPAEMDRRFAAGIDVLAVEADGSRAHVVKAPGDHEPVIPGSATHVLAVIGADGLDRVIQDVAHRPMLVAAVCSCGPYERLTVERATALLLSDRGLRKAVPAGAAFAVAITRIGPRQRILANRLAARLAEAAVPSFRLPLLDASLQSDRS